MKKIVIIVLFTMLFSCIRNNRSEELQDISIGIHKHKMSSIITTAYNLGYFEKYGLNVEIKTYPSGKHAIYGINDGETDLAASSDIPIIHQFVTNNRSDLSIIATIAKSNAGSLIITRKDSGISSPKDLVKKKIGFQKYSEEHFYFHLFYTQYGITKTEFKPVYIESIKLIEALQNNDVSSIVISESLLEEARGTLGKDNIIEFYDSSLYSQPFVLTGKDSFLSNNQESVELFLKACIEAEEFLNDNGINFETDLDQSLLTGLEDLSRWIIEEEELENEKKNVLLIINSYFLKSVKPQRVKIITKKKDTIRIADTPQPLNGLIYIAQEMGYFKDEGIKLEYKVYSSGKECLDSLLRGEVEIATAADSPFVNAILKGEDIYNISTIQNTGRNVVLLGLKDRGIYKPNDLYGKKIGVTIGSGGEYFVDIFLLYNGIDKNDVEIIDVKPNEMFNVIKEKKVDAVCTWNPHVINIQTNFKENITSFYAEELYVVTFNLITDKPTLKNKKDTLIKFVKALIRAEEYVLNNQESSIKLISSSIKMDEDLLKRLWNIYNFKVSLDKSLVIFMNELGRWTIEKNKIDESSPNFNNYFYPDILMEIKPESVRLE